MMLISTLLRQVISVPAHRRGVHSSLDAMNLKDALDLSEYYLSQKEKLKRSKDGCTYLELHPAFMFCPPCAVISSIPESWRALHCPERSLITHASNPNSLHHIPACFLITASLSSKTIVFAVPAPLQTRASRTGDFLTPQNTFPVISRDTVT